MLRPVLYLGKVAHLALAEVKRLNPAYWPLILDLMTRIFSPGTLQSSKIGRDRSRDGPKPLIIMNSRPPLEYASPQTSSNTSC